VLETKFGTVTQHGFFDPSTGHPEFALQFGDPTIGSPPLVRVHSGCMTGDSLGSLRCNCGHELVRALELIKAEGRGFLIYLPGHEGRGIGALQKILAYNLQSAGGLDTYESNRRLGFAPDYRRYQSAAGFLRRFGVRQIRLIGANPAKRAALEAHGIEITEMVRISGGLTPHNRAYLKAKVELGGHHHDLLR
jgi:GTP cyclohydrolase II